MQGTFPGFTLGLHHYFMMGELMKEKCKDRRNEIQVRIEEEKRKRLQKTKGKMERNFKEKRQVEKEERKETIQYRKRT